MKKQVMQSEAEVTLPDICSHCSSAPQTALVITCITSDSPTEPWKYYEALCGFRPSVKLSAGILHPSLFNFSNHLRVFVSGKHSNKAFF